ncbi:hypothetical protein Tco_1308269, partial [Tanacetum coccineum]
MMVNRKSRVWSTVATVATWHATSACRPHVSLHGSDTSADKVPLAYVAATSAADVAKGIITLLHRIELGTS